MLLNNKLYICCVSDILDKVHPPLLCERTIRSVRLRTKPPLSVHDLLDCSYPDERYPPSQDESTLVVHDAFVSVGCGPPSATVAALLSQHRSSAFFPAECLRAGFSFFWKKSKIRDWRKKDPTHCCSVSSVFELVYFFIWSSCVL